ncbi:MAG TPA: hypothetical protein V6C81_05915 [Planktothrix sp.]
MSLVFVLLIGSLVGIIVVEQWLINSANDLQKHASSDAVGVLNKR